MDHSTIEGLKISLVIIAALLIMAPILYWSLFSGQRLKH